MKKVAFILALILTASMLTVPTFAEANPAEVESNNTANTANVIDEGIIEGTLNEGEDVDYYKFDANQDYFTVSFGVSNKNLSADTKDGWIVTIYDKDMKNINSFETTSAHTTARYAISGTIYVKVEAKDPTWGGNDAPLNVLYELKYATTEDGKWESEYNDLSTSANTITANTTYRGSVHNANDADWFKVTSKDYFTVTLGKNTTIENGNSIGDGWLVTLYDSAKKELSSFVTTESATSIKYPLSGTVYVKVEAKDPTWGGNDAPINVYYDLIVNTATDSKWENEYNDSSTTSNTITQGVTYHGNLHAGSDVDFFKVKSTTGAIAVRFTIGLDEVEPENVKDGWKITIYAQDSANQLASYTVNAIGSFDSVALPYAKGKYYYVKVEAKDPTWGGNDAPINEPYHIAVVDASEGKTWEVENGKTVVSSATALAEGKAIYGNLYTKGDKDYFKCSVVSAGTIDVTFKREDADNDGDGYKVSVIDAGGKTLAAATVNDVLSGKLTKITVSKGTYYIVVTNAGYTAPGADINYNVSYKLTLKTPTVKSVSATTNTIKATWDKRSDVAGYQIQYATSKSFSGAKTVTISSASTTSTTIKSTSATKVYYVRMRTVVKDGSSKRYSAWSTAKVAINTPAVKSVSTTSNTIKATWSKNTGATGYQIQYATSKSFSGAKTVSISKNSTTSTTIKSTSAAKVYYVRMRTVLKDGSKTTYSAWSTAKVAINTPALKSVTTSKNTIKATWSKNTGATGYQIQYATSKSFSGAKTVTISKNSVTNVTIKNTSANKTYYVRIRTVANGTYSPWSTAKTIKSK